ncbi:MAG: hypothetical protein IPK46_21595 [Saprospiraceae bacterium]|nr:hypothetical protein [Saprospiraceae bacterium]
MIHLTLALWLVLQTCPKNYNCTSPDWGFWGHRKLNKMAVFTLPREMDLPRRHHQIQFWA